MHDKYFIAGDWGSTNLRLYLCQFRTAEQPLLLETRFGEGVIEVDDEFENCFFSHTQDWFDQFGNMPVMLSGMVGSNIGWKEAPYLNCPIDVEQICEARINFQTRGVDFSILAGLRTANPLGFGDVMRGEELQLLGWMLLQQDDQTTKVEQLIALPGTHNKWCYLSKGKIETFLTAFTGELFGLLQKDSVLVNHDTNTINQEAFINGLNASKATKEIPLVHSLFSTRSKQVLGEIAASDGSSYLSGMIIGADILGAADLFRVQQRKLTITIIGEPELARQYCIALRHLGIEAQMLDSHEVVIAGFAAIFKNIYLN